MELPDRQFNSTRAPSGARVSDLVNTLFTNSSSDLGEAEFDDIDYLAERWRWNPFRRVWGWITGAGRGRIGEPPEGEEPPEPAEPVTVPSPSGPSVEPHGQLDQDTQTMVRAIAKAGRDNQLVRIRYRPKVTTDQPVSRTIEPYSLRIRSVHVNGYDSPSVPTVVLFGYDQHAQTIKMFVMDRIRTIEQRPRSFRPRWNVEFESIQENNDRCGRCYELAGDWLLRNPDSDATLVHGHIYNKLGSGGFKHINHAWIVKDNQVWDPAMDRWWPEDAYYGLFDAEEFATYTHDELRSQTLQSGHWGPWDERSVNAKDESLTEREGKPLVITLQDFATFERVVDGLGEIEGFDAEVKPHFDEESDEMDAIDLVFKRSEDYRAVQELLQQRREMTTSGGVAGTAQPLGMIRPRTRKKKKKRTMSVTGLVDRLMRDN